MIDHKKGRAFPGAPSLARPACSRSVGRPAMLPWGRTGLMIHLGEETALRLARPDCPAAADCSVVSGERAIFSRDVPAGTPDGAQENPARYFRWWRGRKVSVNNGS